MYAQDNEWDPEYVVSMLSLQVWVRDWSVVVHGILIQSWLNRGIADNIILTVNMYDSYIIRMLGPFMVYFMIPTIIRISGHKSTNNLKKLITKQNL